MSQYSHYPVPSGGGSGVSSLNSLTGALTLVGGTGITVTPSGSNITIASTGVTSVTGTAPVVSSGGTTPAISMAAATTSVNGYLTSTDWNTFNGKQASGNYLTALTGDGTASGPGSAALTLATVNSNVGSFTYGSFTVNAKGLITAASSGTAPVTSVGFSVPASSIFAATGSPVTSTGTLGFTVTGVSGGIPYFDSTSTLHTSSILTANQLLVGGGAGSSPAILGTLGTTTTVLHGNASGAPTFGAVALATDVSGTLQAAQFPALTGDVTTSAGSLATSIGAGKVTNSMLAGSIDLTTKVTGVLPIANGGTGASTAAGARTNLFVLPTQQTFTSSGTYTLPTSPTPFYVKVTVVGGGGGGGGAANTSGGAGGGGGGGGGTSIAYVSGASLSSPVTVTIGGAGSAGVSGGAGAGAGGTTSFGSFASATGGTGGGAGVGSVTTIGIGGTPGVGSLGTTNISGQGGAAGSFGTASIVTSTGGQGGGSFLGGGGRGTQNNGAGVTAGNYGSGGSGGSSSSNGGAGSAGYIIVEEFYQ